MQVPEEFSSFHASAVLHGSLSTKMSISTINEQPRGGEKSTEAESNEAANRAEKEIRVKQPGAEMISLGKRALQIALELGDLLIELKLETKLGKWGVYVKDDLGITSRRASNYMDLARNREVLEALLRVTGEHLSDLGIREALDQLAKHRKSKAPNKDRRRPQIDASSADLKFADGSTCSFTKLKWKDGLVSKTALVNGLQTCCPEADDPKAKARTQRAVVLLSSAINSATGNASPDKAMPLVDRAYQIAKELMSHSQSSTEGAED